MEVPVLPHELFRSIKCAGDDVHLIGSRMTLGEVSQIISAKNLLLEQKTKAQRNANRANGYNFQTRHDRDMIRSRLQYQVIVEEFAEEFGQYKMSDLAWAAKHY